MLAELPDLWDFCCGSWEDDSGTSRFEPEAAQQEFVRGLKQLTTKPVVGVGRFTSPDTMVDQIRGGILDLIGAARPSIADPFLPRKIEEGRLEDIRECIGCNICVSGDMHDYADPVHPEPDAWARSSAGAGTRSGSGREESDARVMVVGAGPAGLEAARALGQRGYEVVLAEAGREIGGRVTRESRLPGLHAWQRVVDHREQQLRGLPNVQIYRQSPIDADDTPTSSSHVVLATGARWRPTAWAAGTPRRSRSDGAPQVLTPDDIMAGERPSGPRVVIFDDDHYYLGGVLAELLAAEGHQVRLVTPAAQVSAWTVNTLELTRIRRRVMSAGVAVDTNRTRAPAGRRQRGHRLRVHRGRGDRRRGRGGAGHRAAAGGRAGQRDPGRAGGRPPRPTVTVIGDAWAPGTIAAAVWSAAATPRSLTGRGRRARSRSAARSSRCPEAVLARGGDPQTPAG